MRPRTSKGITDLLLSHPKILCFATNFVRTLFSVMRSSVTSAMRSYCFKNQTRNTLRLSEIFFGKEFKNTYPIFSFFLNFVSSTTELYHFQKCLGTYHTDLWKWKWLYQFKMRAAKNISGQIGSNLSKKDATCGCLKFSLEKVCFFLNFLGYENWLD